MKVKLPVEVARVLSHVAAVESDRDATRRKVWLRTMMARASARRRTRIMLARARSDPCRLPPHGVLRQATDTRNQPRMACRSEVPPADPSLTVVPGSLRVAALYWSRAPGDPRSRREAGAADDYAERRSYCERARSSRRGPLMQSHSLQRPVNGHSDVWPGGSLSGDVRLGGATAC